jgi:anti-sigma B factor antagonist
MMSAEGAPSAPSLAASMDGDKLVVALAGELDFGNSNAVQAALMAATSGSQAPVLVDIGDVTFLDSSILRVLIVCRLALEAEGRTVLVRNASEQARRVFAITQLTDMLAD